MPVVAVRCVRFEPETVHGPSSEILSLCPNGKRHAVDRIPLGRESKQKYIQHWLRGTVEDQLEDTSDLRYY